MNDMIGAAGRPSKYRPEFADTARRACELGARDVDLAETFGVSLRTIGQWKVSYPEFAEALKLGKASADDAVERSLYQRATGFAYESVKIHVVDGRIIETPFIEHFPPDTTACIFWLKNRRPAEWRDRHEVAATVAAQEPLDLSHLSQAERDQMRAILTKGAKPPSAGA